MGSGEAYEAHRLVSRSEPVVLEGSGALDAVLARFPCPPDLARDAPDGPVRVLLAAPGQGRTVRHFDAALNVPGSIYHVRKPPSRVEHLGIGDFLERSRTWKRGGLFLDHTFARPAAAAGPGGPDPQPAGETPYGEGEIPYGDDGDADAADPGHDPPPRAPLPRMAPAPGPGGGGGLEAVLIELVDWGFFERLARAHGYGGVASAALVALPRGCMAAPRYESADAVFLQLHGRVRVSLVPPAQALSGAYCFPVRHPLDRHPMADLETLDPVAWPASPGVRGRCCVLGPGDALVVPAGWLQGTEGLSDPAATAVRVEMVPGARAAPEAATALELSRCVERWASDLEGTGGAREFLVRVAAGGLVGRWDPSDLRGYERTRLCQEIRDEAAALVGRARVRELLSAIVDHRLMPTGWLDDGAGDPLRLADRPAAEADDRSEWERKYPQLFRGALEERGWHVEPTVSTVRIPGR